jgi:AraC-like DNA-binding protein
VTAATTSTQGILQPAEAAASFTLTRLPPADDLAEHVERHWIVAWDRRDREPFEQRILPHPCVNLVAEPGLVAVHGIPSRVSAHRLEGQGMAIGTKFRPGGFAGFHRGPASALRDRALALSEVFGAAGDRLEPDLAARAGDPDAHIEAVETFLRARRPAPDPRFMLVREVVADMLAGPPETTVAELARRHGVSERTLQRLFGRYVGMAPKWVLRRYRMHEAAERIAAGEAGNIPRLALELGYFDQSHFIGDFTAQIGCSPGVYARACRAAAYA